MSFYQELKERGLLYQVTEPDFGSILENEKLTLYVGFDPTSDSLHIGNLLGLVTLKRFYERGHRPIAVVGGATGMIGDPGGKSQERLLLSAEKVGENVKGISKVISRFIPLGQGALLLNNLDWFQSISAIQFLRDCGKHFTVNYMLAKDSVSSRLGDREQGISFTEFSYMLLQSWDFFYLNQEQGCTLQMGGSDQWGNITAGTDLIRKKTGKEAYGWTWPLVTKADGTKFGKTESGTIWLSEDKTPVFDFYQFFLRTSDSDVIRFLKSFTFLSLSQIDSLAEQVKLSPEKREAQIVLAEEMTRLVHGEDALEKVKEASKQVYQEKIHSLSKEALELWVRNAPSTALSRSRLKNGLLLIDLLVETKLSSSKGQARQDLQGGGIYVNDERVTGLQTKIDQTLLLHDSFVVLRKGKKSYHCLLFNE